MIFKCKCGAQLILNDDDYNSAQKERVKKVVQYIRLQNMYMILEMWRGAEKVL